jgi:group II intron reverse transcriptase/maturase
MAAKLVIEPIFEADFQPCSYGFRPKKSATQALEAIRVAGNRGHSFVVDADIQGYFDNIDRNMLMELVKERISDRRVLKLVRQWLECGVMEDGTVRETLAGTPQGGVISPLLANIYLNKLDRIWAARCGSLGVLVRYADDFVAMCRTESQAREALRRIGLVMNRLGLKLHPEKTRMVDLRRGKESFVFLGCTIRKKRSIQRNPRAHFVQRWPSPKATKRIRERVHELTDARHSGKDVKQIIATLNPCSGDGETTSGREMPNGSSISWTAMSIRGLPDGWVGEVGSGRNGWRSGPMNVSSVWVCTDCVGP